MEVNNYEFDPFDYLNGNKLIRTTGEELLNDLRKIGFEAIMPKIPENKIRFDFNPTLFAMYMSECVIGRLIVNGDIALYRIKDGYYEIVDDIVLGKLIMALMSQGGLKLWSTSRETHAIAGYKRILNDMVVQFDTEDIINLKNGIFDLATGELKPHSPDHLTLGRIETAYDPEAKAPEFKKFIDEICCHDQELNLVMYEIIGYTLTRSIKAEKCFYFYGNGANGKSTLIKVIHKLVGRHNISEVSLAMLSESFGLESLIGKYINIVGENEVKGKMATEILKAIISGDPMSIPRKYKKALEVVLICKLIHVINNLPQVDDISDGYWRKVMVIPFNAKFKGVKADKFLMEKLSDECSGILNLALIGLKRLEANNYEFSKCKAISKIGEQYQLSQKPAVEYFLENYEIDPSHKIHKTLLYDNFCEWAKENGKTSLSSQKFWGMLELYWKENGITYAYKKSTGTRYLVGFAKKPMDEEGGIDQTTKSVPTVVKYEPDCA